MGRGENNLLFNPPIPKSRIFQIKELEEIDLPSLTVDFFARDGLEIILAEGYYERRRGGQAFATNLRDVDLDLPYCLNDQAVAWLDDNQGRADLARSISVILQTEENQFIGLEAPEGEVENLFASNSRLYSQTDQGLYILDLQAENREWKSWDGNQRRSTVPGLALGDKKSEKLLVGKDGALFFFRHEETLRMVHLASQEGQGLPSVTVEEDLLDLKQECFALGEEESLYLALDSRLYLIDTSSGQREEVLSLDSEILALDSYGDNLLLLLASKELIFLNCKGQIKRLPFPYEAEQIHLGRGEFIARLGSIAKRFAY